ncbi:patatin-like phospholipase family protein [Phenylobacterium sp. J367]|uniref:patatin-like phospholipase family protein n=1 Tax=Phenylobacterium sp. J367 TaxID=2898435 RepID=UPI0021509648|nr:patatin-like phospholipase family protein [Phenylobacterium sp. J367]MCR5878815.1 patatin-like phospholipase family protein [Phenylobacterium sp. J367]
MGASDDRDNPRRGRAVARRLDRRALIAAAPLALAACGTTREGLAVPAAATARAEASIPGVRFLPDRDPEPFERLGATAMERERAWLSSQGHRGPLPPAQILAVSGGGGDGAFGAGLLAGWTRAGDRPSFKMVTGVSTGALIAPFAFLGPDHDATLHVAYTRTTDADIFKKRHFTAAIWGDALTDTTPMAGLIAQYVTPDLLRAIAGEYAKGRLLMVGTTNLDAREAVYWDMGRIATQGDETALKLFRQITLASAAIPGAFPPVMIDVTVDGQRYQEMHVDGGATRQVFMYPQRLHLNEALAAEARARERRVYIIMNARLDPDWASVDRRTLSIAGRAVASMIQTQGIGDLMRMYITSRRDGIDYNLAYIPSRFTAERHGEFDPAYMKALFELGQTMAATGYPWDKVPPGYGPNASVP